MCWKIVGSFKSFDRENFESIWGLHHLKDLESFEKFKTFELFYFICTINLLPYPCPSPNSDNIDKNDKSGKIRFFFFSTIFKLANLNFKTLFKFSSIKSSKQVPKSYRRSVTPHQSAGLSRQTSLFTTTLWNYRTFHHRIKLIGRKIENFYRVFPDAFARAVNPLFLNSGYTNPYSKDPANIRATNGQEFVYRIATTSKHERVLLSGDEVGVRLYHNGPSHTNIFRSRQM